MYGQTIKYKIRKKLVYRYYFDIYQFFWNILYKLNVFNKIVKDAKYKIILKHLLHLLKSFIKTLMVRVKSIYC